jgi:hypothetical protein
MNDQAMSMPDFNLDAINGVGAPPEASAIAGAVRALTGNDKQIIAQLINELKGDEKLLDAYLDVQHLQLAKLQHRLLSNGITDQKIYDAPLRDVVSAFKALKDKELVAQGKPTEIHGLVGYLVELEKEENEEIDITPEDVESVSTSDDNDDKPSPNPTAGVETNIQGDIPCL